MKDRLLTFSYEHKLTHIGSNLTALDIIDKIYAVKKPDEKFVLSAGHAHLAHAVVKEKYGQGKVEDLMVAGIHCDKENGCDISTGSLGQGLPIALGMAIADRGKNVYCLVSDGEMAEGSCWEALRIKAEQKVDNLKIYVNANGWSAYGMVDRKALEKRMKAFCPDIHFMMRTTEGLRDHYRTVTLEEYDRIKKT